MTEYRKLHGRAWFDFYERLYVLSFILIDGNVIH